MAASSKKVVRVEDAERLEQLPNVGRATAMDLRRLGIEIPSDLANADPKELYDRLCALDGVRHDPCVLDVLMAAVAFVRGGKPEHWAAFTSRRKTKWPEI